MSFRIVKELSKVETKDDKFLFSKEQEDEYDAINVYAMVKGWERAIVNIRNFLDNYDENLTKAIEETKKQFEAEKLRAENDKKNLLDTLAVWKSTFDEWCKANPRKVEQIENELLKAAKDAKTKHQ